MKKFISLFLAIFIISSSVFQQNARAFTAEPNTGDYLTDTTITINLKAAPSANENAVSINLSAVGMTILSYTPPSGSWIGPTGDCENKESYTSEKVCASLAKTETIVADESLGTITVNVKGSTYAKLVKTSENAYSDGKTIRNDEGTLLEFNKSFQQSSSANGQSIDSNVISNLQPIILIVALVIIILLVLLMLWPKIRSKFRKQSTTNSTPF